MKVWLEWLRIFDGFDIGVGVNWTDWHLREAGIHFELGWWGLYLMMKFRRGDEHEES